MGRSLVEQVPEPGMHGQDLDAESRGDERKKLGETLVDDIGTEPEIHIVDGRRDEQQQPWAAG